MSFPLPCPSTVHPQCHCLPWHLCCPRSMASPRPHIGMVPSSLCPLQSVSKEWPQLAFVVGTNSQELLRACCVPSSVLGTALAFPKCSFHGGDTFFCLFGCAGFLLWHVGFSLSGCSSWAGLPCGMWDLSSLTRDQTLVPCIGKQILNHWATREVPGKTLLNTQNHNDHNEGDLGRGTGSCLRPGLFWSAPLVQSSGGRTGPGTRWALSNMH